MIHVLAREGCDVAKHVFAWCFDELAGAEEAVESCNRTSRAFNLLLARVDLGRLRQWISPVAEELANRNVGPAMLSVGDDSPELHPPNHD